MLFVFDTCNKDMQTKVMNNMKTITVFLFLLIGSTVSSQKMQGTILWVTDGDTFAFLHEGDTIKVRMQGIDAPEKKQEYGLESKKYLQKYDRFECTVLKTGVDRYKRTIGVLFIEGKDINYEMIRTGNAWHYKRYSSDENYAAAEDSARTEKIGLWYNPSAIPPWDYRRR